MGFQDLISNIKINIMKEWISNNDLIRFEIANMNSYDKNPFDYILAMPYFGADKKFDFNRKTIKWLIQKKVKLTSIDIVEFDPLMEEYILNFGKYVKRVLIHTHMTITLNHLIFKKCQNLNHLMIRDLSEQNLDLISKLTNLKYLDIYGNVTIEDKHLLNFFDNMGSLEYLKLSNFTELTDNSIINMTQKCKQLKYLKITNIKRLTDACIEIISKNCTNLVILDFSNTFKITKLESIKPLENIKFLSRLRFSKNINLLNSSINQMLKLFPYLVYINIESSDNTCKIYSRKI